MPSTRSKAGKVGGSTAAQSPAKKATNGGVSKRAQKPAAATPKTKADNGGTDLTNDTGSLVTKVTTLLETC